jgi:hypothetical protein
MSARSLAGQPITTTTTGAGDAVVHGAYGHADAAPGRHTHLALTWTQALPSQVICAFTNPRTGAHVATVLPRALLLEGGGAGDVHVELAGTRVWIDWCSAGEVARIDLVRAWLDDYLHATEAVVAIEEMHDNTRRTPAPDGSSPTPRPARRFRGRPGRGVSPA